MEFILKLNEHDIDNILCALNSEINFGEENILDYDSSELDILRCKIITQQAVPKFHKSFVVSGTYDNGVSISDLDVLVFAENETEAKEDATDYIEKHNDDIFVVNSIRPSNEEDIFSKEIK